MGLKIWKVILLMNLSDELNHRAQKGTPGDSKSLKEVSGTKGDLSGIPPMSIVNALREKQRVIYGTDDRKDLYEVHNKKYLELEKAL